jgi:hypothetical protein
VSKISGRRGSKAVRFLSRQPVIVGDRKKCYARSRAVSTMMFTRFCTWRDLAIRALPPDFAVELNALN